MPSWIIAPRAGFLSLVTLLAAASGCASSRSATVIESPPAPSAAPDSALSQASLTGPGPSTSGDSARMRARSDSLASNAPLPPENPRTAPRATSDTLRESAEGVPAPAAQEAAAPTAAAPVGISIELGAEEAAELGRQIAEDLDHAEQSIRTLNRAQLAGEDAVRLETAETLIRDARQERDEGDLRAAATLAHKAKLLAEELSAE